MWLDCISNLQDAKTGRHLCEDYCEFCSLYCNSLQETVQIAPSLSLAVILSSEMFVKILRVLQTFRTMLLKLINVKYSLNIIYIKYSHFRVKRSVYFVCVFFLLFTFDPSNCALFQIFKPLKVFAESESTVRQ